MPTGEVEVLGSELKILNEAKTPPFQLDEYSEAGEDIRLRYRYMDLRRPEMQQRMQACSYYQRSSFLFGRAGLLGYRNTYFESSHARGCQGLLGPSRTHPGEFFALPSLPKSTSSF